MRTYKGPITKLGPNQIFVFGSNTQGRHGKGAALWAFQNAGAKYGCAYGIQGSAYAICTKNLLLKNHPSINPERIIAQINQLYSLAHMSLDKDYVIAYSDQPNLNGYTPMEMAAMFVFAKYPYPGYIPHNIIFEESFLQLIYKINNKP